MSEEINVFISEMQRAINYREMAYKNQDTLSREHICFCLHQSIEYMLKSVSKYFKKHIIKTHSLRTLNENIRQCSPQVYEVLSDESYLLYLLDKIYAKRLPLEDECFISKEMLFNLFEKVTQLQEVAIELGATEIK